VKTAAAHPAAVLRRELEAIAADLAFSWHPEARELFAELGGERFEQLGHNPAALLAELDDGALERLAGRDGFAARVAEVAVALRAEETGPGPWPRAHPERLLVAYFSCEFGLDESLPIYSGGLGVLAGDHLKSASELALPLVGVGLFYTGGYFRQGLDSRGRQTERYPRNDPARLPLTREPAEVAVELAAPRGGLVPVRARIWRARVGRVRLYLLDTDVPGNPAWARSITDALYGGDREHRLEQELVLGLGGVRALRALGLAPDVFHLNEGHSAFLQLERLRELVAGGAALEDAVEQVRAATVFTTHTPVPAGNETFAPDLLARHLRPIVEGLGLGWADFLALGRVGREPDFGLTPFALRTSAYANGVSELHGEVSRDMWRGLWPGLRTDDVPIQAITNGIHGRTWLAPSLGRLLVERGVRPEEEPARQNWPAARELDDSALWEVHGELRRSLVDVARRGGVAARLHLDPEALTIGFARRFATYKRAGLLFSQPERLGRLLGDPERPLQILLAGKAHPADEGGKALIEEVVRFSRSRQAAGRVVFLEDYEMTLARRLVQGADVWLNTPRRPQEASGTSGMKAGLNGVLNCSTLDGWWCEGYSELTGFQIRGEPTGKTEADLDAADAEALFAVLEDEIVPLFYDRDARGLPASWLAMMKESIVLVGERFTTGRMVWEYGERLYLPAGRAVGV
jgi:starch phosphorylase